MKHTILSLKQSSILENLVVKYGGVATADQLLQEIKATAGYTQPHKLVNKLVQNGWLVRIKRGLYAISDLSSRGFLSLSPYVVANLLVEDSYVSFESALQQFGMFDQLTNKTVSVSLKMYKTVSLNGVAYSYIRTKSEYFFGWQEIQAGNRTARVATPEKALIDIINFHRSKSSVDLMIEKLSEHKDDLDLNRLNDYLVKFSIATIKIFGLMFDLVNIDSNRLHEFISSTSNHRMFPEDTKFNAKWRLYYDPYFDKYQGQ